MSTLLPEVAAAILGTALTRPAALKLLDQLQPEHFTDERDRALFVILTGLSSGHFLSSKAVLSALPDSVTDEQVGALVRVGKPLNEARALIRDFLDPSSAPAPSIRCRDSFAWVRAIREFDEALPAHLAFTAMMLYTFADPKTGECNPGQVKLAKACRQKERKGLNVNLGELERLGWITRRPGGGRTSSGAGISTTYQARIPLDLLEAFVVLERERRSHRWHPSLEDMYEAGLALCEECQEAYTQGETSISSVLAHPGHSCPGVTPGLEAIAEQCEVPPAEVSPIDEIDEPVAPEPAHPEPNIVESAASQGWEAHSETTPEAFVPTPGEGLPCPDGVNVKDWAVVRSILNQVGAKMTAEEGEAMYESWPKLKKQKDFAEEILRLHSRDRLDGEEGLIKKLTTIRPGYPSSYSRNKSGELVANLAAAMYSRLFDFGATVDGTRIVQPPEGSAEAQRQAEGRAAVAAALQVAMGTGVPGR